MAVGIPLSQRGRRISTDQRCHCLQTDRLTALLLSLTFSELRCAWYYHLSCLTLPEAFHLHHVVLDHLCRTGNPEQSQGEGDPWDQSIAQQYRSLWRSTWIWAAAEAKAAQQYHCYCRFAELGKGPAAARSMQLDQGKQIIPCHELIWTTFWYQSHTVQAPEENTRIS